jgi:hypothetical protein
MRILGTAKTDLGDVDCVMTVCLAQHHRCGCGEHLVEQEGSHASSACRCWDMLRLRSATAWFRSIRSLISAECSAA